MFADGIHMRRTREMRFGASGSKGTRDTKKHDLLALEEVGGLDCAARGTFEQSAVCRR